MVLTSISQELVEAANADKPQEFDFNGGSQEVDCEEPPGRELSVWQVGKRLARPCHASLNRKN